MVEVLCQASKSAKIFGPDRGWKFSIDSYVDILQERLHSCLFFLLTSNSELKKMLSMMVSPPMPLAPHTSRMQLWWYEQLEVNTIGYGYPASFARNHRMWGEIILTSRCIKWSYFTQFTSTMSMLGIIHSIMHNNFTSYIQITNLVHLTHLEMINSSLFYWLCALCWLLWRCFFDMALREVPDTFHRKYRTISR